MEKKEMHTTKDRIEYLEILLGLNGEDLALKLGIPNWFAEEVVKNWERWRDNLILGMER